MMVHVASSSVDPSIGVATGFRSFRYRMENVTTRKATAPSPTTEISTRKK